MSLYVSALNSGSNGNCYYIGNSDEAVLIDAGLSCRETEKRMQRLHLDMGKVKAIFISHEHSDHITGLAGLSKKYRLPVYITPPTLTNARLPVEETLVYHFKAFDTIVIGNLKVLCFPKLHDACDPHSFVVSDENTSIGIFTDIGMCCEQVIKYFKDCHAVILEANYDEAMLEKGNYPYHLKKRIRSNYGHLSNDQALQLFTKHRHPSMTHLILSHLSKNNNCPDLVQRLFEQYAGKTNISVASRYHETEVYVVSGSSIAAPAKKIIKPVLKHQFQLSLF